MKMLLGEYRQALDSEGQFTLPKSFQFSSEEALVLTRGFERVLLIFTQERWQALAERLSNQPISNADVRALRRRLFSGAEIVTPDAEGRVPIPDHLREFAAINSVVVISGLYDHVELWSAENWETAIKDATAESSSMRWQNIGL
jgi:MraZ protein